MSKQRPLYVIAADIRQNWKNVRYSAEPYLAALEEISYVNDVYLFTNGRSLVRYFLSNASYWRGAEAKRIKAELKGML